MLTAVLAAAEARRWSRGPLEEEGKGKGGGGRLGTKDFAPRGCATTNGTVLYPRYPSHGTRDGNRSKPSSTTALPCWGVEISSFPSGHGLATRRYGHSVGVVVVMQREYEVEEALRSSCSSCVVRALPVLSPCPSHGQSHVVTLSADPIVFSCTKTSINLRG